MKVMSRLVTVTLVVTLLVLAGCTNDAGTRSDAEPKGSGPDDAPTGMVVVETDLGSVARPQAWKPAPSESVAQEASFLITDDAGETVGQMDVILNTVTPGTRADAVAAAADSARLANLPTLRHTTREFTDVPGAASAFVTESTYRTSDTGEPALSLDQVAVTEAGDYMLVRITAAKAHYDAEFFTSVVDTMKLSKGAGS